LALFAFADAQWRVAVEKGMPGDGVDFSSERGRTCLEMAAELLHKTGDEEAESRAWYRLALGFQASGRLLDVTSAYERSVAAAYSAGQSCHALRYEMAFAGHEAALPGREDAAVRRASDVADGLLEVHGDTPGCNQFGMTLVMMAEFVHDEFGAMRIPERLLAAATGMLAYEAEQESAEKFRRKLSTARARLGEPEPDVWQHAERLRRTLGDLSDVLEGQITIMVPVFGDRQRLRVRDRP
jgi:hypothetical protein